MVNLLNSLVASNSTGVVPTLFSTFVLKNDAIINYPNIIADKIAISVASVTVMPLLDPAADTQSVPVNTSTR